MAERSQASDRAVKRFYVGTADSADTYRAVPHTAEAGDRCGNASGYKFPAPHRVRGYCRGRRGCALNVGDGDQFAVGFECDVDSRREQFGGSPPAVLSSRKMCEVHVRKLAELP
ncbi:hypothetical protein CS0771_25910 [Catellatospora sp. IY07-71]|nr:hypothetical protein CS0771_25910 [Catellatospora sp. IY07-71]